MVLVYLIKLASSSRYVHDIFCVFISRLVSTSLYNPRSKVLVVGFTIPVFILVFYCYHMFLFPCLSFRQKLVGATKFRNLLRKLRRRDQGVHTVLEVVEGVLQGRECAGQRTIRLLETAYDGTEIVKNLGRGI